MTPVGWFAPGGGVLKGTHAHQERNDFKQKIQYPHHKTIANLQ